MIRLTILLTVLLFTVSLFADNTRIIRRRVRPIRKITAGDIKVVVGKKVLTPIQPIKPKPILKPNWLSSAQKRTVLTAKFNSVRSLQPPMFLSPSSMENTLGGSYASMKFFHPIFVSHEAAAFTGVDVFATGWDSSIVEMKFSAKNGMKYLVDCSVDDYTEYKVTAEPSGNGPSGMVFAADNDNGHIVFTYIARSNVLATVSIAGKSDSSDGEWGFWGCEITPFQ